MKRLSPFSKDFWIKKGYTESEAEYKRNSIRPIRKEYWLEKGHSEEEAIEKAKETKANNNKKGANKSAKRSIEDMRKGSPRCKEYWLEKGYSEEESNIKISDFQAHGSLESFTKKYGIVEGYNKWKKRQIKWQNTLKSKSKQEIDNINNKKSSIRLDLYNDLDEAIDILSKTRNMKLFKTPHELADHIIELSKENPYILYMTFEKYYEERVSKIQKNIFENADLDLSPLENIFNASKRFIISTGNKQAYRKWASEGLLRSSYEIYFYDMIKQKKPNIDIKIDEKYPSSNMRFDFLLDNNIFIEICPMIHTDEKYKHKMNFKKKIFDCVLLSSIEEIDTFIEEYTVESNSKTNN